MATELLRDTLHLLPQGMSSDCGGNRKKASSDAKTAESNAKETSKVTGLEARGEDLDSGAVSPGISVLTKMIQEEGKRIAPREKKNKH